MSKKSVRLKLKGKAVVLIDWANVYHWQESIKREVQIKKLWDYLSTYSKIKDVRFYYGEDDNSKSKRFLNRVKKVGYTLITKPVKYIKIDVDGKEHLQRKCDFDLEIGLDVFESLDDYKTFVFFSGDGDFKTLYERLVKRGKQVLVVFAQGHLGREVRFMGRGVFLCNVKGLGKSFSKKISLDTRPRARLRTSSQKSKKKSSKGR